MRPFPVYDGYCFSRWDLERRSIENLVIYVYPFTIIRLDSSFSVLLFVNLLLLHLRLHLGVHLNLSRNNSNTMSLKQLLQPTVRAPLEDIVLPPGFEAGPTKKKKSEPVKKPSRTELDQIKVKKAWDIATGPAKSIPMNLIMSYMTGNSLQMIPIMMAFTLLLNPLKAIFTETGPAFSGLVNERNSAEIIMPKILFVLCQLANMAVGVWKLSNMGLIPNKEADWLGWKVAGPIVEKLSIY